jgi:micrococcal nuclease
MNQPLKLLKVSPLGTLFVITSFLSLSVLYLSIAAARSLPSYLSFKNTFIPVPTVSQAPQVAGSSISQEQYLVVKIIDGDTIEIEDGSKIRYIGIDTPEKSFRTVPDCYAQESTQYNRDLVMGKHVSLEKDISETDRFGRLLRYVWVDGVMINEKMVRDGYALASSYPPDVRYQDVFLTSQQQAVRENLGLWSSCR